MGANVSVWTMSASCGRSVTIVGSTKLPAPSATCLCDKAANKNDKVIIKAKVKTAVAATLTGYPPQKC